jgi:diadenosine tetraphosphate (Ap4A) HIT family hydrolase
VLAETDKSCPFCAAAPKEGAPRSDRHCFELADSYPVSPGHSLVVARRHVGGVLELGASEMFALFLMAREVMVRLAKGDKTIKGFNVGFNDGEAAGQTIPHVHVHVIPRRKGDMKDPRGGIRGCIPDKRIYKKKIEGLRRPGVP